MALECCTKFLFYNKHGFSGFLSWSQHWWSLTSFPLNIAWPSLMLKIIEDKNICKSKQQKHHQAQDVSQLQQCSGGLLRLLTRTSLLINQFLDTRHFNRKPSLQPLTLGIAIQRALFKNKVDHTAKQAKRQGTHPCRSMRIRELLAS